jgi:hypothetical protein
MVRANRWDGRFRTLAKMEVQMGSTSSTLAALMRVWSLSACKVAMTKVSDHAHTQFRKSRGII